MNNDLHIEEALQKYLDGRCTGLEAKEISRNIETIPEWKQSFQQLSEIHELLQQDWDTMQPSMRFTKNVMEDLAGVRIAKPAKEYINPKIVWLLGGLLLTMLLVVTGYAFSLGDWSKISENPIPFKFPTVDWSSLFNRQTTMLLLLLNTVLGFTLFDFWLRRKKAGI